MKTKLQCSQCNKAKKGEPLYRVDSGVNVEYAGEVGDSKEINK